MDMYAAQKPHFPELETPEMKQSPASYESPDQIGHKADGAATGLGLGTAAQGYRGTSGNGLNPGDATRPNRQSELPGSMPVTPGFAQGTGAGMGSPVEHGGGGGGLHITNPSAEAEPSELPGSTYHPYRPQPGGGR